MKMRITNKLLPALLLTAALFCLAGCSLAQPERSAEQNDRFAGLYMVYEPDEQSDFYQNAHLSEYGDTTVNLGKYGTHSTLRRVLFAQEDGCFPDLDGLPLYVINAADGQDSCTRIESRISDSTSAITVTDEGTLTELSGTLYIGPPADASGDWSPLDLKGTWKAYRVYQTADGRAYLDGSGSGFNGIMTYTCEETQNITTDKGVEKDSLKITVTSEEALRIESAVLLQYKQDGTLLGSSDIPLTDNPGSFQWLPDATWAVVREITAKGTVHVASYDRPASTDEPVTHQLILLDDSGIGREVPITIE